MKRHVLRSVAALGSLSLFATPALAHGFGNRYELALPMWLFFVSSVFVVVASFGVVSAFGGRHGESFSYRSRRLSATPLRFATRGVVLRTVRACVVLVWLFGLVVGFVGPQTYDANLYTLLVWVVWWVGYTFSVILCGNTWPTINPWTTIYEWAVVLAGRDPSPYREYRLGALPALAGLFGFGWLEIVSPLSQSPRTMATLTVAYSIVTWTGMSVYGPNTWMSRADPFARLYRYLGKFAPLSARNGGEVRMYGVGLIRRGESLEERGALPFLVLVLYLVTFDGFVATPAWRALVQWLPHPPVHSLLTTLVMLAGLMAFVEAFLRFAQLLALAAGTPRSEGEIARRFALSLLPIAIGYQLSHYYVFLLLKSQFLIPVLADPFGLGWNLLGTGAFEPATRVPFLTVRGAWLSQVVFIVLGHVVSVWVAHHIALETFEGRRQAVKSQVPMTGLMVTYTTLSLWILTLPVLNPVFP